MSYPGPQRRVNPKLKAAIRASGIPGWHLALISGLNHHAIFSRLINSKRIPATDLNVQRLERIASTVGFDPNNVFIGGARG